MAETPSVDALVNSLFQSAAKDFRAAGITIYGKAQADRVRRELKRLVQTVVSQAANDGIRPRPRAPRDERV